MPTIPAMRIIQYRIGSSLLPLMAMIVHGLIAIIFIFGILGCLILARLVYHGIVVFHGDAILGTRSIYPISGPLPNRSIIAIFGFFACTFTLRSECLHLLYIFSFELRRVRSCS